MNSKSILIILMLCLITPFLNAQANLTNAYKTLISGDLTKAEAIYLQILKQDQTNTEALLYLAMISDYSDNLGKAEDYIERAYMSSAKLQAPTRAKIANWRGIIMERQAEASSFFSAGGYAKKALASYIEANKLAPEDPVYLTRLTTFYLEAPGVMGGNTKKGERLLQSLMKLSKSAGYKVLIEQQIESDQDDRALDTFTTAINEFPNEPELFQQRAFYWLVNKEFLKASQDLRSSFTIQTDNKFQLGIQLISLYQYAKLCIKTKQDYLLALKALDSFKNNYQWVEGLQVPSLEWAEFRRANILDLNAQTQSAQEIYVSLSRSTKDRSLKKLLSNKL